MKDKITWETINRYVDGELPPRDVAEVAKAVAADPEYAEQISVLSSLKAAVAHSTDGLDRHVNLALSRKAKLKNTLIFLAASLATVLLLG
jgi:anti-sigma factor RsiW